MAGVFDDRDAMTPQILQIAVWIAELVIDEQRGRITFDLARPLADLLDFFRNARADVAVATGRQYRRLSAISPVRKGLIRQLGE